MRVELNYWPSVDWTRERKGNPVVRYLGVGVIFALLALGWFSVRHAQVNGIEKEHQALKEQSESLETETALTAEKSAYGKLVKSKVLTRLDQMTQKRMVWSRNLEVIPGIVPNEMILSNFILRSFRPKLSKGDLIKLKKEGKKATSPLIYVMTIAGLVEGDMAMAEQAVEKFSYDLASEKGFGTKLKSAELKGLGKTVAGQTGEIGVSFTIGGTFHGLK